MVCRRPVLGWGPLLLSFFVGLVPLAAEDSSNLYSMVAPQVAYLRHEVYLDGSKSKQAALWKRLETAAKTSVLNAYVPIATGSGFFIDDHGRMITNRHVVQISGIDTLRAITRTVVERLIDGTESRLTNQDKTTLKADLALIAATGSYRFAAWNGPRFLGSVKVLVQAAPQDVDLALVEVSGYTGGSLELGGEGDTAVTKVGTDVASFGYPLGDSLDAVFKERVVTMNRGAVSAFRATELLDLQHSAAISRGNSGGPLVDSKGRVLGVNAAGFEASQANSLFYAVSSGRIRTFLTSHGYGEVVLWNQRLARMAGAEASPASVAAVEFVSEPSGATVVADGRNLGTTPVTLRLPPGTYAVSLTLKEHAFVPQELLVTAGTPTSLRSVGRPAQTVRISLPSPETNPVSYQFTGTEGTYPFSVENALLPEGKYALEVTGVPGLVGVSIPVTIVAGTSTLDLAPFYRSSDLTVRGFEAGSLVWVDGKPWAADGSAPLKLPMGAHSIALWKDGRQPLSATIITVREPGVAFLTWKKADGFEVQRDRAFWSGLALTGLGAAATGAGWYLGQDAYAVPRSKTYQDYTEWKASMGQLFVGGIAALVVGASLDVMALQADLQYQAQRKEFGR